MDNGFAQDHALAEAKRELETWRAKVEKADDEKARLKLEKLAEDDSKKEAQKDMEGLLKKQEQCQQEFKETMKGIQDDILRLDEGNKDLMDKLRKRQAELESRRAESAKLKQKSKIFVQIPEMQVKFTGKEESEDNGHQIKGVFTVSQRPTVLLKGGQALITFEEEKVASQILKMARCSVSCEDTKINVKPKSLTLEPCVKFEVHIDISKKELMFSNAPPSMSEEQMRDRLEMSFSRPSRGGGEVESVDYNQNTGKGKITFLHTGVAENLSLKRKYQVDVDSHASVSVNVGPVYNIQLRQFQIFCGVPKRTILLDGIQDLGDEEDLQDQLEIHFQQPINYGGEVDNIKYISSGKICTAYFSDDMVEAEA